MESQTSKRESVKERDLREKMKWRINPNLLVANHSHDRDAGSHKKGGEKPVKKDRIKQRNRIALRGKPSYPGAKNSSDTFEERCEKCPKSND